MNNILLTGSNGFLGNIIFNTLKLKCNLYTLNRKVGNYIYDLNTDVPNFKNNFDIVIHTAGVAHVEANKKNGHIDIYKTNLNMTKNLLKSLLNKPKVFIYISSVSVYGIDSGELISENAPLLATDQYGLSKINSENLIINWCKNNNLRYLILRLPLLIGNNPKGNLKNMIKAIKNNYYFEIENGKSKKSMLLAEDVANNILAMSEYEGIFNLTDGYHPTFHEITTIYAKLLHKNINLNFTYKQAYYLSKFGDLLGSNFIFNTRKFTKITSNLTFDDSLARTTFNWKPKLVINNVLL